MLSGIPKFETIRDKQELAKALSDQISKPEAQQLVVEDISRITRIVAIVRERFKVTGAKLRAIDKKDLAGGAGKWSPPWDQYRNKFEGLLITSKDSASRIAAYGSQFEDIVRFIVKNQEVSCETKLKFLEDHANEAREFEKESEDIAKGFQALIADLSIFKAKFSAWIVYMGKQIPDELKLLDTEIAALNEKIKSLKKRIATVTTICGAITSSGALGLIPHFTVFIVVGALVALAASTYYLDYLNNKARIAESEFTEKELMKVELSKRLDEVLAVQKEFEAEISDQVDNIKAGLSLFESIWRNVVADCKEISDWLEKGAAQVDTPPILYAYVEKGNSLYGTLTTALNMFVRGVADT